MLYGKSDTEKYGMAESNEKASGTAASRAITLHVRSSVVSLQSQHKSSPGSNQPRLSAAFDLPTTASLTTDDCLQSSFQLHTARRLQQHHIAFASFCLPAIRRLLRV